MEIERNNGEKFVKKIKKKCIVFVLFNLFVASQLSFGAFPTAEGLFRNGNNSDLTGNLIIVRLQIEEIENRDLLDNLKILANEEKVSSLEDEEKIPSQFLEFVFSIENEHTVEMIQVNYKKYSMKKASIEKVLYVPNLIRKMRQDSNYERLTFYSMMMMFVLNDSKGFGHLFKKINPAFRLNSEMMFDQKIYLLDKYKKHLAILKNSSDGTGENEISSPLKPEQEEEKERVNEILSKNIYNRSEYIKLIRQDNRFYWQFAMDKINSLFYGDTHRIRHLSLVVPPNTIEVSSGDYILFDGVHELPKKIIFKGVKEKVFNISMIYLRHYTNKGKTAFERYKEYKKNLDENKKLQSQSISTEKVQNFQYDIFLY